MKSVNCFFYILSIRMSYFVVLWRRFNAEAENIRKWADGGTYWYTHILNKLIGFYCNPKEKWQNEKKKIFWGFKRNLT